MHSLDVPIEEEDVQHLSLTSAYETIEIGEFYQDKPSKLQNGHLNHVPVTGAATVEKLVDLDPYPKSQISSSKSLKESPMSHAISNRSFNNKSLGFSGNGPERINSRTFTKHDNFLKAYLNDSGHLCNLGGNKDGHLWTNALLDINKYESARLHRSSAEWPQELPLQLSKNHLLNSSKSIAPATSLNSVANSDGVTGSEDDPSVFSISGRRVIVSYNGHKEDEKQEEKLLSNHSPQPKIQNRIQTNPGRESLASFKKCRRLQRCTDSLSLFLFVPGTIMCMVGPWLLVPLYLVPSYFVNSIYTLLYVCCLGSIVILLLGCLVGNMYWYKSSGKWKCIVHCGKGPKSHYWGENFGSKKLKRTTIENV